MDGKGHEDASPEPVRGLVRWFARKEEERRAERDGDERAAAIGTPTTYFYYCCGGRIRDTHWGCAYRCVQMMIDNASRALSSKTVAVPTIVGLQRTLVRLNAFKPADVFTRKWMDPLLAEKVLSDGASFGARRGQVMCVAKRLPRSSALRTKFLSLLWYHFKCGARTPVMYDDDTYAYIVAGVRQTSRAEVLVFDPHVLIRRNHPSHGGLRLSHFDSGVANLHFRSTSPIRPEGCARWIPYENLLHLPERSVSTRYVWMFCFFDTQRHTDSADGGVAHSRIDTLGHVRRVLHPFEDDAHGNDGED